MYWGLLPAHPHNPQHRQSAACLPGVLDQLYFDRNLCHAVFMLLGLQLDTGGADKT